jgi:hypothetical protein
MTQLLIALFGLTSIWCAMGNNPRARKWAPIIGLAGQPFWFMFSLDTGAWGLLALVAAYTAVYLRGIWVQWGGAC